jgi:hypothetical protein
MTSPVVELVSMLTPKRIRTWVLTALAVEVVAAVLWAVLGYNARPNLRVVVASAIGAVP